MRAETDQLKKSSARYRSEIAELKRRIAALEAAVKKVGAGERKRDSQAEEPAADESGLRFRADGFASHRKRLALSAAEFGKLIGVTAQTIYNWEAGETRPRASQMQAVAAVRKMGKKEVGQALDVLAVAEK